ncbi:Transposase [Serratia plymuthica]|nr:Transposase [Serratia plymuthica]
MLRLMRWSPPPCERYADRVFFFLKGIIMQNVTLIGIDLGKHSFHVHAQDKNGNALLRKKFSRNQLTAFLSTCTASTVVMESCAGAHFMARHISQFGHQVKLISPQFVRPFVKSNKNDFIDAEAICEAASRPSMRFVTPRTEDQQVMIVFVMHSSGSASKPLIRCTRSCWSSASVSLGIKIYAGYWSNVPASLCKGWSIIREAWPSG